MVKMQNSDEFIKLFMMVHGHGEADSKSSPLFFILFPLLLLIVAVPVYSHYIENISSVVLLLFLLYIYLFFSFFLSHAIRIKQNQINSFVDV